MAVIFKCFPIIFLISKFKLKSWRFSLFLFFIMNLIFTDYPLKHSYLLSFLPVNVFHFNLNALVDCQEKYVLRKCTAQKNFQQHKKLQKTW